jgi:FixJ family two-component response regulator
MFSLLSGMISFFCWAAHYGVLRSTLLAIRSRAWAREGRIARVSKSQIVSIVDDDASVRAAMRSLLRSLGFVAFAFESAEDFLRSPRVDDSSCLITDVQMPGMSGLDLQDRLIAQGSRIPIIFITAFPEHTIRSRVQASGALGFLEKPFAGRTMIELVRQAVATQSCWSRRVSSRGKTPLEFNARTKKGSGANWVNAA